jgi:nitrate reductase molybdenum cofactor assembly chaperone NarJ/NarW
MNETQPQSIYRLFAELLSYPTPALKTQVRQCDRQLAPDYPQAAELITSFESAIANTSIDRLEEIYTSTFDVNPICFPYPGFHLFGESFKRGEFLVKLQQKYQEQGFKAPENELADHLPVLLQFLSTLNTDAVLAQELIEDCLVPALQQMSKGFKTDNPYATLLPALLSVLQSRRQLSEIAALSSR